MRLVFTLIVSVMSWLTPDNIDDPDCNGGKHSECMNTLTTPSPSPKPNY
jgi:hypothetical protein